MKPLRRFAELQPQERIAFLIAFGVVAISRLALWVIPFPILRRVMARTPSSLAGLSTFSIEQLRWAVLATARRVPQASCLTQAMALQWLMTRSGRPSHLRIGVAKDAERGFRSHAWIEYQQKILIGDNGDLAAYVPMASIPAEDALATRERTV